MRMIKVESSNVKSIGYSDNTLYVLFKNGGLYQYKDVPVKVYDDMLVAESVGIYLNKEVKKVYETERIWDDDPKYMMLTGFVIDDLTCCGNCDKFENNPQDCARRKISDYDLVSSDCCVEWVFDGYTHEERMYEPYYNSDGN